VKHDLFHFKLLYTNLNGGKVALL